MKFRIKNIIFFVLIIIGILFVFFKKPPIIDEHKILPFALIEYSSEFNYRQTINDCGPFNTAAVFRTLKGEEIDSQIFVEEIKWRLPNKYTLPWGLEKQLKENDISIKIPNLKALSDTNKILFLQQQLSQKKPVIILGGIDNFEHYITIFGFDAPKDKFYVYDSLHEEDIAIRGLTKDDNGNLPGNKSFNSKELLDFWRGGGMYGVYKWYALVAG